MIMMNKWCHWLYKRHMDEDTDDEDDTDYDDDRDVTDDDMMMI
jgi:hypothetical protein